MKQDKIYISFILESIGNLEIFLGDDPKIFFLDLKTEKAIIRTLHEITETTQRISIETKSKIENVDWRSIASFRNILVHDYLGDLDHDMVFKIITENIPELKTSLQDYIKKTEGK
jgi:uncharacterized protein with HEPN domain